MNRKLLFSFLAALGTVVSVKAQRNELGVRLGMSNLVGDIGRTNYILQKPLDGTDLTKNKADLTLLNDTSEKRGIRFTSGTERVNYLAAKARTQSMFRRL